MRGWRKKEGVGMVLIFLLLMFLDGCHKNEENAPARRSWWYEEAFEENSDLYAAFRDTVILNLGDRESSPMHRIHHLRYRIKTKQTFLFCFDPGERTLQSMHLSREDDAGFSFVLSRQTGCKSVTLPPGTYRMRIKHDPERICDKRRIAFVSQPHPYRPMAESPPILYRNVVTVSGRHAGGFLGTLPRPWLGESFDFLSVIDPEELNGTKTPPHHLFFAEVNETDGRLRLINADWNGSFVSNQCDDYPWLCDPTQKREPIANVVFADVTERLGVPPVTFYLSETGDGNFTVQNEAIPFLLPGSQLYSGENRLLYQTLTAENPTEADRFRWGSVRMIPDGSDYYPEAGEVMLGTGCGMKGPAYILTRNLPNAGIVPLDKIRALRFGSDYVTMQLYAERNYTTPTRVLGTDEECLADPIPWNPEGSVMLFNAEKVLLSSHRCEGCNLDGVDLRETNLSGFDLRGSDLSNARFGLSWLRNADLSYTLLSGANFNGANLEGSTLCAAMLGGSEQSDEEAASFVGSYLKNVNLSEADLDGADFSNSNFYSSTAQGCVPQSCAPTACASAVGSTLDNTRFTNAYLYGTDFSDTTLKGADFSYTVLTNARFKNAVIDRDPDSGVMSSFQNAYLEGTDFDEARVRGSNFYSAYVDLNQSGNLLLFLLNGTHTDFAGWPTPGNPVCVMAAYSQASQLPTLDSGSRCPDGSDAPCSESAWIHPVIPMKKNPVQPASYFDDPDPVCTHPDFNW